MWMMAALSLLMTQPETWPDWFTELPDMPEQEKYDEALDRELYNSMLQAIFLSVAPELATDELKAQSTENLLYDFKDPEAARVEIYRVFQEGYVCGKVNGKNSYGAYTGYKLFVATPNYFLINNEHTETSLKLAKALINAQLCALNENIREP